MVSLGRGSIELESSRKHIDNHLVQSRNSPLDMQNPIHMQISSL